MKKEIIKKYECSACITDIARELGKSSSTIATIFKDEEKQKVGSIDEFKFWCVGTNFKSLLTPTYTLFSSSSIFILRSPFQLLQRLLRSKNPEDHQAANRLIKNIVKEEEERREKGLKRMSELEKV